MVNFFGNAIPNLQPYSDPQYFVYLLIAVMPLAIGLYYGKRFKIYETIFSIVFIVLMFTNDKLGQGVALIAYIIWQLLVVGVYHQYRIRKNNSLIFYLATFLSIVPLSIVKIMPAVDHGAQSIIGFLGISYLTFRAVGMIMEMRDGVQKDFRWWPFLRFMVFMPTISSGPIDRYRRFEKDYDHVPDRDKYVTMVGKAVQYIFLGFLYKFILAYFLGTIMLPEAKQMAISAGKGLSWPLLYVMYTYGFDLFFDFAGYSLFAVAISYLMGIETPMNFKQPFKSKNLKEFWNRWHISLSFWFRDFVFMRMVFAMKKRRLFKKSTTYSSVAYVLNMLLMGFWHGVTWYYIAYGLFHGLGLMINDWWLHFKRKHLKWLKSNWFTQGIAIFLTFHVVMISFLLFSGFLNVLWFVKK
ncbi:D-alanyl-lipoteichoic acid biosynthesis protein DltB [Oenococcus oeni]|uniref:D-alanyl-lipoteichoic acid biosynthesis protein DltB n=1 Tax=Oenococcus oeni TaxID=1247 RepID=UPI0008F9045C|nr:D-alanyl-lipoteichoic acid biosynthesis protein DltB [Oenococcus oeni]OIK57740.1 D-alanyl-lipoteichoic acid biosynthesis protein DltB [Oenococcus oeni]OIK88379.1 D-alanyl-lipoteichoic acid biosynthesis protein DltB [Oenococcus oeni]OIL10360.1 D-alanyl-lipoteichoic acid biosynthesis protein DltB [Oenococcus oeni]OIL15958.1 D-alanyl-lipoteichoic acid biosynthesis protein DltB [Oenococcus oeni]OIM25378.1 D-alanyl-lipoteichoic acid biosynthesis protein DltB [Oenococcus oeni]